MRSQVSAGDVASQKYFEATSNITCDTVSLQVAKNTTFGEFIL
jgi:hypothetical protein